MADPADATVVQRKNRTTANLRPADLVEGAEPQTEAESAATRASRSGLTYRSPQESMNADEVMRTRTFLKIALVLCVVVAAILPLLGGDHTLKRILQGAIGACALSCAGFLWWIRDDARYSPEVALAPAAVTSAAALLGCLFFGLFSPGPMVLTFGIYFFSLSSSVSASIVVYVMTAGLLGAGMALQTLGFMPDTGLVRVDEVKLVDRWVMIGLVQAIFAITFALARLSRRSTLAAMTGLEQALKQVGQREALLQEANQDLERALRGGYRGRWSGELVGSWKLADVIGRGAMGEVYEASHVDRDVHAAVKLLHGHVQADPQQLARFLREAEVTSKLDSPHVVRVHEVGLGAGGTPPFLAMELLRGHDLAWHLRKRRRLSARRVVELAQQVASALEAARGAGIVHRDLKPQNLFLAETEGREDEAGERLWKVLDFGVSKLGLTDGTLTRGHVVGTPGYMAPEQARGVKVDHRADVFALAVISYRALTGRPAFSGDEYPKIMFDLVYLQPVRPGEHAPLPNDVDLALALGLAKEPDERFETAAELASALHDAARDELAPALRERAERLLARQPWGARIVPK